MRQWIVCVAVLASMVSAGRAQIPDAPDDEVAGIPVNYTEAKTGSFTLPDPLVCLDGTPVRDARTWFEKRRPEILRLFQEHQFGVAPGRPAAMHVEVLEAGSPAFGGKVTRRQLRIYFTEGRSRPYVDVLVYLPEARGGPVPVLLHLGFSANNTVVADANVVAGMAWDRRAQRRVPASRGLGRLNVLPVVEAGFALATFNYADFEPDAPGALRAGVRALALSAGQDSPDPNQWGAIGAWAWGVSRVIDAFEADPDLDARRVAILGVSRLGKTALWAAARDRRVALVIASCSGEGGAALSRRNYGETVAHLVAPGRFAYWFCGRYAQWADRVDQMPIDAHMLLALIAPRPLLLQTGSTDRWSDPTGEFLAARAAEPVWRLLAGEGLGAERLPEAGRPLLGRLGFVMHEGGHGVLPEDWPIFLEFINRHLR